MSPGPTKVRRKSNYPLLAIQVKRLLSCFGFGKDRRMALGNGLSMGNVKGLPAEAGSPLIVFSGSVATQPLGRFGYCCTPFSDSDQSPLLLTAAATPPPPAVVVAVAPVEPLFPPTTVAWEPFPAV